MNICKILTGCFTYMNNINTLQRTEEKEHATVSMCWSVFIRGILSFTSYLSKDIFRKCNYF